MSKRRKETVRRERFNRSTTFRHGDETEKNFRIIADRVEDFAGVRPTKAHIVRVLIREAADEIRQSMHGAARGVTGLWTRILATMHGMPKPRPQKPKKKRK